METERRFNTGSSASNVHRESKMSEGNKRYGTRDGLGRTLLHLAAEKSDVDKIEELLSDGGFDVNAQDAQGRTPLHSLFDKDIIKDMDTLKRAMSLLLKYGANVNIKDKFEDTPLHVVFYSYEEFIPEIIRFLLTNSKQKFDLKSQNNVGYTVFYKFMCGFPDGLREEDSYSNIIQQMESFINDFMDGKICQPCPVQDLLNMKDKFGFSTFYIYTINVDSNIETIKRMIQLGADVNLRSNVGATSLMDVVLDRVTPIVKVLLESGADVNNKDIFGQTALFRVLTKDCFDLLQQYGADFKIRDKFGRSPITDVFMYTPEDTPRSGLVISDMATNRQSLFELFLKNGVSVHEIDNFGSSLLHYAAWFGAPKMASALIEHGLPRTVVDNKGISPAELAQRVGNYELLEMLTGKPSKVEDPVKRHYVNLLIYHEDVGTIDKALHEVSSFPENPRALLQNLINSPRLGLVNRESEAQEVKDEILKLMNKIAESISTSDPAFICTVYPTGSSEDGSKIGEADEFDFTFCLDFFSDECIPYQEDDTLNSGFATLKVKSFHESHPLAKYTTDEYFIESYIVRDTFQDLFTNAVNTPEIWNQNCFYFDGLLRFPVDKPILNMEVHWCGRIMKNIVISIDVVPAVRTQSWIPIELKNIERELPSRQFPSADECFLLFQPPQKRDKQKRRYLRISRFSSELKFLKSLPEAFLESYAAAKVLICDRFCPRLLFSEDLNIEEIFCEQTSGKNSSVEDMNEEMDSEEDSDDEDMLDVQFSQKQTMGSENDEHSVNSDSDDAEMCSGIIEGTILYKNGAARDLSSCVIEVDQTLRANRLFVPKGSLKLTVSNLSFYLQNGELQARENIVVRSIEKDTSRWIQLGPSSDVPKNESLDAVITDSLSREENQSLTISEWLNRTFPSVSHPSDGDMEENTEMDQGQESISNTDKKLMENNTEADTNKMTSNEKICSDTDRKLDTGIFDISWEGGEIVDGYDTISSYMLKNCLFYVAVDLKDATDISQLDITIKLFEKLGKRAEAERLPSFFLPYLDVFTFANEHIKMIPDDEILESTKVQCSRIKLFCDVILGILRQKTTA